MTKDIDHTQAVMQRWFAEPRIAENEAFVAIYDRYPVNDGHVLIVSRRTVPDIRGLTADEFALLQSILVVVIETIDRDRRPGGYTVGSNCGKVAGQTVMQFHMHVIPRYPGDVEDPRGGIRNIKAPLTDYPQEGR